MTCKPLRSLVTRALLALGLLTSLKGMAIAENTRIAPDFACPRPAPQDGLAQMICDDLSMSREEMTFEQAYYANRHFVGPAGWRLLKTQAIRFNSDLRTICNIPQAGASEQTMPANTAACYIKETEKDRALWLAQLPASGREEASRPIEINIRLQQRLVDLGFLPPGTIVDGVYGDATRGAIVTWQRVTRRTAADGFLSDADADALLSTTAAPAAQVSQPAPSWLWSPQKQAPYTVYDADSTSGLAKLEEAALHNDAEAEYELGNYYFPPGSGIYIYTGDVDEAIAAIDPQYTDPSVPNDKDRRIKTGVELWKEAADQGQPGAETAYATELWREVAYFLIVFDRLGVRVDDPTNAEDAVAFTVLKAECARARQFLENAIDSASWPPAMVQLAIMDGGGVNNELVTGCMIPEHATYDALMDRAGNLGDVDAIYSRALKDKENGIAFEDSPWAQKLIKAANDNEPEAGYLLDKVKGD